MTVPFHHCYPGVTADEQQELLQIRNDFDDYLTEGEVSEGQVRLIAVAPATSGFLSIPNPVKGGKRH